LFKANGKRVLVSQKKYFYCSKDQAQKTSPKHEPIFKIKFSSKARAPLAYFGTLKMIFQGTLKNLNKKLYTIDYG
jgi:hypothetical protein